MPSKPRDGLRDRVAVRVAGGMSVAAAARAESVPERTARLWAATPEFQSVVKRARDDIIKQAVGVLSTLSVKAAVRLGKLLDSESEDVALKACGSVLDKLMAIRQHADIETQLAELRALVEAPG